MKGFLLDCFAGVLFAMLIILFLFTVDKQAAKDSACHTGHVAWHAIQTTSAANLPAITQRSEK